VGWLADKLSIVELKIYHMQEQADRRDRDEDFLAQCRDDFAGQRARKACQRPPDVARVATGARGVVESCCAQRHQLESLGRACSASGIAPGNFGKGRLGMNSGCGDAIDLEWAGLAREEERAGGGTLRVFGLALLVMALVLAALYENFLDPLIILVTVPLALLGAVAGLAARGLPLDVYGQMGLLVLASLAAKNGILIVEFANQRLAEGMALDQAIHGAAVARLRPILLTTISSLVGYLPLLFASGTGASSRMSIGTVVFSGQLVATVLSLVVVPAIYRIVKGWERGLLAQGAAS
jgi:hypothetical protein